MQIGEVINDWLDDRGWMYLAIFTLGFGLGYIL